MQITVVVVFTVSVIHVITFLPLSKELAENDDSKGKITHIGFLRVHKCGSATMSNIIFRFGLHNNLTFAIPKTGGYITNTDSLLPVRPTGHYDILIGHSIYSRKLYQYSFGTDSVNIAIVRDPVQRMISAAYFYRDVWPQAYLLRVPKSSFIENLVRLPHVYDRAPFSYTRNSMGRDFGFSSSISINDTDKINQHLDMLKKDFKLVLVQERFDESLVLMKRTLNWDIEDILYVKINANKHKVESLSSDLIKKLQETCFLDVILYETFSKIFDEKVKDEGPEFYREVEWFQNVLRSVSEFCNAEQVRNIVKIDKSEWNEPFHITQENCSDMKMGALTYLPMLRNRHKKMNN
jgi:hypothetical protein